MDDYSERFYALPKHLRHRVAQEIWSGMDELSAIEAAEADLHHLTLTEGVEG